MAVTDLAARQSGDSVVLTFTLPHESTQREPLSEPPAIEIYRAERAPSAPANAKLAARLVDTIPPEMVNTYESGGRIEFHDAIAADELAQKVGSLMLYTVRTRASKRRASADSNAATLRVYPAPEDPIQVQATVTESAILLSWTEKPSAIPSGATFSGFRVYRAEIEPAPPGAQFPVGIKFKTPVVLLGQVTVNEYRDSNFEFGRTYAYSVLTVVRYGDDSIESPGILSGRILTPRDTFPPATPQGLLAVVMPSTAGAPAYIELSWNISPETDLAGYYVYRSESSDTPGARIDAELLPSPAFRDTSVSVGKSYFYRVSAVDRAGNESPLSRAVEADVPQNQR